AAKNAVSQVSDELLAAGPAGALTTRHDLSRAHEQLLHFKGWVYAAVRPIAQRIAGQPLHVRRVNASRELGTRHHLPQSIKALTGGQDVDVDPNHELAKLFADPNPLAVAWSLMFVTVASLEITGRQLLWFPDRKAIWPVPTSWIKGFEGTTKFTS